MEERLCTFCVGYSAARRLMQALRGGNICLLLFLMPYNIIFFSFLARLKCSRMLASLVNYGCRQRVMCSMFGIFGHGVEMKLV